MTSCDPRKLAEKVEETLRTVSVPGFDVDVVSCGALKLIRVSSDCRGVVVYLDLLGSRPGCLFCSFINDTLWSKIVNDIVETLKKLGFEHVEVTDIRARRKYP